MKRKDMTKAPSEMTMVHPNAAAIDIAATMHMAAVGADRTSDPVQSFGTFTGDLQRLADWFTQCGVKTVVMESTSVYWIPIFELLDERGFEVFLVNARDSKHVPGRKTPMYLATCPSKRATFAATSSRYRRSTSPISSGSSRPLSSVEPTRSTNIKVN